jgi:hypothetical protein
VVIISCPWRAVQGRDRSDTRNLRTSAAAVHWDLGRYGKRRVGAAVENSPVNLARIAWLCVVLACLVTVLILTLQGYYGYAGVTLAVAIGDGINLF